MTGKAPEPPKPAEASTQVPAQATPAPAAPPPPPPPPATPAAKAPAKPPAKAKPPKTAAGVAGGAFVVAVCALLVAIGSIGVSIYSLKVARDALSKNADREAAAAAPTSEPASAPTTSVATPGPTTSPRVVYFSEFVRAELKIPAPTGCNAAYVDVDTLAVGNSAGHEFYLSNCVEPMSVRVDRTSGASSTPSNPTPEACASLLAGTQGTQELVLAARTGLTFCLLTNRIDASSQNLPQRLAIIEVKDVAVDKTVTIVVSTFRIL